MDSCNNLSFESCEFVINSEYVKKAQEILILVWLNNNFFLLHILTHVCAIYTDGMLTPCKVFQLFEVSRPTNIFKNCISNHILPALVMLSKYFVQKFHFGVGSQNHDF